MNKRILITGNEAIGKAAIDAGCDFYAGYPITPQNELTAYMAKYMPENNRIFIQAESELAAISMIHGASAAGARVMTSSSSPGISLKQEGISYIAGSELPAVIVNIMRGGPGLGNIAPSQSDYFQATKGGGHGDYRNIVLAPATVEEAMSLTHLAFDLADQYRNPVIILGDGILGQMMEAVQVPKYEKKFFAKPWALNGAKGRERNIVKSFFLQEGKLEGFNLKLQKKYALIKENESRVEIINKNADIFLVAYGSMARICKSVVSNSKLNLGLIRPITLWPFAYEEIKKLAVDKKIFLTVEMSSGQMVEDVLLAVEGKSPVYFYGRSGGGIPKEEEILDYLNKILEKKVGVFKI